MRNHQCACGDLLRFLFHFIIFADCEAISRGNRGKCGRLDSITLWLSWLTLDIPRTSNRAMLDLILQSLVTWEQTFCFYLFICNMICMMCLDPTTACCLVYSHKSLDVSDNHTNNKGVLSYWRSTGGVGTNCVFVRSSLFLLSARLYPGAEQNVHICCCLDKRAVISCIKSDNKSSACC